MSSYYFTFTCFKFLCSMAIHIYSVSLYNRLIHKIFLFPILIEFFYMSHNTFYIYKIILIKKISKNNQVGSYFASSCKKHTTPQSQFILHIHFKIYFVFISKYFFTWDGIINFLGSSMRINREIRCDLWIPTQ